VAPVHLANKDRLLAALTGDERLALAGLVRRLLASFETHATDVAARLGLAWSPRSWHNSAARRSARHTGRACWSRPWSGATTS
jgi:hypothetical protein